MIVFFKKMGKNYHFRFRIGGAQHIRVNWLITIQHARGSRWVQSPSCSIHVPWRNLPNWQREMIKGWGTVETSIGYFQERTQLPKPVLYNCISLPPCFKQQYDVQLICKTEQLSRGVKSITFKCNCFSLVEISEIHGQGQQGTSLNCYTGQGGVEIKF